MALFLIHRYPNTLFPLARSEFIKKVKDSNGRSSILPQTILELASGSAIFLASSKMAVL